MSLSYVQTMTAVEIENDLCGSLDGLPRPGLCILWLCDWLLRPERNFFGGIIVSNLRMAGNEAQTVPEPSSAPVHMVTSV
jgi:hypothetical protein